MSLYVISKQDDPDLNSPVFHAGPDGGDEAVAAFTSAAQANAYIQTAGWQDEESVAELQSGSILRWLLDVEASGTSLLTVDPNLEEQNRKVPQPTLSIQELVDELVELATQRIVAPPPPTPSMLVPMDLLHCQHCGKLIEQQSGGQPPECCGQPMTIAAGDSKTTNSSGKQ